MDNETIDVLHPFPDSLNLSMRCVVEDLFILTLRAIYEALKTLLLYPMHTLMPPNNTMKIESITNRTVFLIVTFNWN